MKPKTTSHCTRSLRASAAALALTCVALLALLASTPTAHAATRIVSLSGNLNFGEVEVGASLQQTFTISNIGDQNLVVQSIDFPAGFTSDFVSGPVHPGQSQTVTVTFAPTAPGAYGNLLTVNCNRTSGNNTLAISGVGTNPPVSRIISVTGPLNFPDVIVGSSTQLNLTLMNSGNSPLSVSGITYPAGFSGDFVGFIAAGGTQNVTVTFAPVNAVSYGGTVTVGSDATSGVNTSSVTGNGLAQSKIISLGGALAFGDLMVGNTAQLTLYITNGGNTALSVDSIQCPVGFSAAFTGAIAPGAMQSVTVTFSPVAATAYSGDLTIVSDATGGVNTIPVSGNGTAVPTRIINLSAALAFGDVMVGSSSQQSFYITNNGNSTLTVSSVSYPIGFEGDFASGTIAAGAVQAVAVTFSSVTEGAQGGTINITSDATSGANTLSVTANGTPVPTRVISVSSDLNFGNVLTGTLAQLTFNITNSGNSALTVSNIIFPAGFSGNFTSGTIATAAVQSVLITFSPLGASNYSGAVTVESDATAGGNTLNVAGTGTNLPPSNPMIALSGDLDFGDVAVGATAQRTLFLTNSGDATLTISGIAYPQGFSGEYTGGIAAGAVQAVVVTFAPTVASVHGGALTVSSDAVAGNNSRVVSGDAFLFAAGKARIHGLVYPESNLTFSNAGYFRMTASSKGKFSAKIRLAGRQYSMTGQLSPSGAANGIMLRKGLSPLEVNLQTGFEGGDAVKGTVSDGVWTANVFADRLTFNKKSNPAPAAGSYTLNIAGSPDGSVAPDAAGTAVVTVSAAGLARVKGTMGDGSPLVHVTGISKHGELPLYGSLQAGRGAVLGWLSMTNGAGQEVSGLVDWFKLPTAGTTNYPDGFTLQTTVTGSRN
jgi:hypothetical protein